MNLDTTEIKQYEEKVSAQLQQAKSQLEQFEARAREKKAQAEIEAINALKTMRQEIDKKSRNLKTSGGAKAAQLKEEIETDMAKLKASLEEFGTKVKSHAATK